MGRSAGTAGKLVSATPPARTAAELRNLADKKIVDQQLAIQEKTSGGMDKNRREVERKRRLMIMQKLHRL